MTNAHKERYLFIVVLILSSVFIYYPITAMHIEALFDPYMIHEETRSRYIYYKLLDPDLFPNDYITDYMQKHYYNISIIYDFMIESFIKYIDLHTLFKILIIICIYITNLAVIIAAWKIGGRYIAWSAGTLCYSLSYITYQITGPLEHMFAFPMLGLFLLAMVYGRVYFMAVVNVLGSFLYLPVGIISGAVMAAYLLIMPAKSRGSAANWSFIKRFFLLSVCGLVNLINVYFYITANVEGYGNYVAPAEHVENFPEAGYGGRIYMVQIDPISFVAVRFASSFTDLGVIILLITTAISIFSFRRKIFFKWMEEEKYRVNWNRLYAYFLSVAVIAVIVYIYNNFISYRLFLYGFGLLYCVVVPLMVYVYTKHYLGSAKLDHKYYPVVVVIIFTFALSFLADTGNKAKYGYFKVPQSSEKIFDFAKNTPKDALFAGMPAYYLNYFCIVDYIPFVAKRSALLHIKGHIVFHEEYILEMRERMNALIDATYSDDLNAIKLLNEKYQVDYFIVNKQYYEERPHYFILFDENIESAFEKAKTDKPFLLSNLDKAILKSDDFYVFDLNQLLDEGNNSIE